MDRFDFPVYNETPGEAEDRPIHANSVKTMRQFETGAVRDRAEGKGRYDLLFTGMAHAIPRVAEHLEEGAKHYGDNNYLKGIPYSVYVDSALRHLNQWVRGVADGDDHLTAAAWNILALLETRERVVEGMLPSALDDLDVNVEPEIL